MKAQEMDIECIPSVCENQKEGVGGDLVPRAYLSSNQKGEMGCHIRDFPRIRLFQWARELGVFKIGAKL